MEEKLYFEKLNEYYVKDGEARDSITTLNTNLTSLTGRVTNLETYSTTETVVGTWIDGKPIYRLVVDTGYMPNDSIKDIPISASIDTLVKLEGHWFKDGEFAPLNYFNPQSQGSSTGCYISPGYIHIESQGDLSTFSSYVILEYTKPSL